MYQSYGKDTNTNCTKQLLSDQKGKLIQAIKRIKHEVELCRQAERETYIESVEVENHFDAMEREIKAEFQNLHRFLDEEECKNLGCLRREGQKQVKLLKQRERKIAEQGRDLEGAMAVLNSKLCDDDSPKLLKEIQDLIKRSGVRFVPPAEVDAEVHSGRFVGPIQYRIWKRMKSCLYPNITPVTFDPDTAHPTLSVSECRASVRFDEGKDVGGCQASPRRFHYYYCLLGLQGFSTGRHYWEVEVGGKTAWRLGVAREDVPRGEMASTGASSGFWTLALKGGAIQACTDPQPTRVTVSVRLARVGVFLDCEKGEVSFYNAVTMAPIYTFATGPQTVPLFPYYNPCDTDEGRNSAPITIFQPSL